MLLSMRLWCFLVVLIGCCSWEARAAVDPRPDSAPAACAVEPKPIKVFKQGIVSCWKREAVAPLDFAQPAGVAAAAAAAAAVSSWAELLAAVAKAKHGALIQLSGTLVADAPLQIAGKRGLAISGPVAIECSGTGGQPAIVIAGSSGVVLQDLNISDCSSGAISISATSDAPTVPLSPAAAATPADVLLQRVAIANCSSRKGGAVAVLHSRVVADGCQFIGNVASGCGGAVYAQHSALLVRASSFTGNLGNNTDADEACRGGAIHAESSWVGIQASNFSGNMGVNGSAMLLVRPVGVAQVQDSTFKDNQPRPGVGESFTASTGAVSVLGGPTGSTPENGSGAPTKYPSELSRGQGAACVLPRQGLAVVRCRFENNTAAMTGGMGGAVSAWGAFLATINSTMIGTAPAPSPASNDAAAVSADALANIRMSATQGGCIYAREANLLVSGGELSHCNGRFVGGGMRVHTATAVVQQTVISNSYGDMGGGITATDSAVLLSDSAVLNCRGLSLGAGMYLEANNFLNIHIDNVTLRANHCIGKGGAIFAEMLSEDSDLTLSMHNSRVVGNQALHGAGMFLGGVVLGELRNNTFAHNAAQSLGGGLQCERAYIDTGKLHLLHNMWLNNSAGSMGGAVGLNPCNVTLHGDKLLGNRAGQQGGGLLVSGGESVKLQHLLLACNAAPLGAGVMVRMSDTGDTSRLQMVCSNITANGGPALPAVQQSCLRAAGATSAHAATSSSGAGGTAAAASAAKGGGIYVAKRQVASLTGTSITSNTAYRSGGGLYIESGARLALSGAARQPSVVGLNSCTGGSGGGLFMEEGSMLTAGNTRWIANQGLFGGGLFAMGNTTSVALKSVVMSNNSAAAGGAIATLGSTSISCQGHCTFANNHAKAGGALMQHGGSITLHNSTFSANSAAGSSGSGSGAVSESIMYMLGDVQASAGGAMYVWRGRLQLQGCSVDGNTATGATGRGGGLFIDESAVQMLSTNLSRNFASIAGGAVLLGPLGAVLEVAGGHMVGNTAGAFGGAAAGGLLLPADTAAEATRMQIAAAAGADNASSVSSSSARWAISITSSSIVANIAGLQGGGIACSLCDSVGISHSTLQHNLAGQTGGGLSCVACSVVDLTDTAFSANQAQSGGGACILAAGSGSRAARCRFEGNAATSAAAAVAAQSVLARTAAAAAAAGAGVGSTVSSSSNERPLPTPQQVLPACAVVGTGGGLCLGLLDAGFNLDGPGRFFNNTGNFGAALFVESCPEGLEVCSVTLQPSVTFGQRRLWGRQALQLQQQQQQQQSAASVAARDDVYVTNASVLVPSPPHAATTAAAAGTKAANSMPKLSGTASNRSFPGGRHLKQQQQQVTQQASLQEPAAAAALVRGEELPPGSLFVAQQLSAATGPSMLQLVVPAAAGGAAASSTPAFLEVGQGGRLQQVQLPVLDQLGMPAHPLAAAQLSVQATASSGACQLTGVTQVLPVNSTARFDQLQLLAEPGSSHNITFKLVGLGQADGSPFMGSGSQQQVIVKLPGCTWGQATTEVGCYNCTSPLFSFSPKASSCNVCPERVAYCSLTSLLPANGFYNTDLLSTRMHKCLSHRACVRDERALAALKCLQQQQLAISNPEAAAAAEPPPAAANNSSSLTTWQQLRLSCRPILQALAQSTAGPDSNASQVFNSTDALLQAHDSLICAKGYTGMLCSNCIFPGDETTGTWGQTSVGCEPCPGRRVATVFYVLVRLFDVVMFTALMVTTLLEIRKRAAEAAATSGAKAAGRKRLTPVASVGSAAAGASGRTQPGSLAGAAAGSSGSSSFHSARQLELESFLSGMQGSVGGSFSHLGTEHSSDFHEQHALEQHSMWLHGATAEQLQDAPLPPVGEVSSGVYTWQPLSSLTQQQPSAGTPGQQQQQLQQVQSLQSQLSGPSASVQHQQQGLSVELQSMQQSLVLRGQQVSAGYTRAGSFGSARPGQLEEQQQQQQQLLQKPRLQQAKKQQTTGLKRAPLFAREALPKHLKRQGVAASKSAQQPAAAAMVVKAAAPSAVQAAAVPGSYTPSRLTNGELFEVLKDFMQVLGILQAVLLGFETATTAVMGASLSFTPGSTKAWASLDCILPRTDAVSAHIELWSLSVDLILPVVYAVALLAVWLAYAAYYTRKRKRFLGLALWHKLRPKVAATVLVLISYFYPSLAFDVISVFSCKYLDPVGISGVPGEVLNAPGWYWASNLQMQCFVDPLHRLLVLGLGIPGMLLLLAYPLALAIWLGRRAAAGELKQHSNFFVNFGFLVEMHRPRLYYWSCVVELRKLVLVAVVVGLASTSVIAQLVGCGLVMLGYLTMTMGLLPYPFRTLNRLHLACSGTLLAVVWLNLFAAVAQDSSTLPGAVAQRDVIVLQVLSILSVVVMVLVLLGIIVGRLYRQVLEFLDQDKDGKVSASDVQAVKQLVLQKAASTVSALGSSLSRCTGMRRRLGVGLHPPAQ